MKKFEFTEYDITVCRFGKTIDGNGAGTALIDTIQGFHAWVQEAKHLADTRIESPGDELYVKESASTDGLYCLVLWRRVGEGNVTYAINAADPPKAGTKVKIQKFDRNDIPGEPLYFIVNPGLNRLFCVRPPNAQRLGVKDFCRAVKFFMGVRSKRVSVPQCVSGTDLTVNVAAEDGTAAEKPVFKACIKRQKAALDRVLENSGQIKNLIHKIPLSDKSVPERIAIVTPLLEFFHEDFGGENFERTRAVTYKISVDGMMREDVEKAIKAQESAAPGQKVGFGMKKSQQTIWADECLMRRTVDIEIESENGIYMAADVLRSACSTLSGWL